MSGFRCHQCRKIVQGMKNQLGRDTFICHACKRMAQKMVEDEDESAEHADAAWKAQQGKDTNET